METTKNLLLILVLRIKLSHTITDTQMNHRMDTFVSIAGDFGVLRLFHQSL